MPMFTPTSTCARASDDTLPPTPAINAIANQRVLEILITASPD
jgi:hypothetical protein